MKQVKIGIVGCGLIAKVHAEAIAQLDNITLHGIFDTSQESALRFCESYPCKIYKSYEEMLADPALDAVSLCTPPSLHLQLACQAAQKGKHLVVEKPLSVQLEETDEMIQLCRDHNVLLCGILQHRFDPLVQVIKKLFEEKIFGNIYMADARILWYRDDDYYNSVPWHKQKKNGGVMLNQAIHYMDLLQYLTGGVAAVTGICRTLGHDIEPEDSVAAALEFSCGAIGTLEASTVCYPGIYAELNFFCQNGSVCIRDERLVSYSHKEGSLPELEEFLKPSNLRSASARPEALELDSHRMELSNFAEALLGREKLEVTGQEARRALALIHAILTASETRSRISCV